VTLQTVEFSMGRLSFQIFPKVVELHMCMGGARGRKWWHMPPWPAWKVYNPCPTYFVSKIIIVITMHSGVVA